VHHKLSELDEEKMRDKIVTLVGTAGDLVVFDSFGFHANCPRIKERRVLMFEFQVSDSNEYPRSSIALLSCNLTDKVVEALDLFSSAPRGLHGICQVYLDRADLICGPLDALNMLVKGVSSQIIESVKYATKLIMYACHNFHDAWIRGDDSKSGN
jgi:hypothetical protein